MVQLNPKTSSRYWGSLLTYLYAIRIKMRSRGNQGGQLKQKILFPT